MKLLTTVFCSLHAIGIAAIASAADAALEEVTVTAQKRPQSLQETPVSLLHLDADQLANAAINDLSHLRSVVPGLQLLPHPNAAGTMRVYLRGIGNSDEQITQDPAVAIYSDGVYIPRSQALTTELTELARIEVLRGPQGNLYGRNATGGAINYITRLPSTEALEWEHHISAGSRALLKNRSSVNLPLSPTLALRAARATTREEGFVDNPGTGVARFGDRDRDAVRLDLLWQPAANRSARYIFDQSKLNDSPDFIGRVPLGGSALPPPAAGDRGVKDLRNNTATNLSHSLLLEWRSTQNLTLRSISSLRYLTDSQNQNYHSGIFSAGPLLKTASGGDQRQRSQELQMLGSSERYHIDYILGAYWFMEEATRDSSNLTPANKTNRMVLGRDILNRSRALFGQLTWTPAFAADRLAITAGARQSLDERRAILDRAVQNTVTGVTTLNPVPSSGSRDFDDLSPALTATWRLDNRSVIYGKIERGYKSGGFNVRASTPVRFNEGFDDESLLSRELGLKHESADRRLRINTALFHASYDDIQINVQSDPTNIVLSDVLNAGRATIKGAELDIDFLLNDWARLSSHYARLAPELQTVRNARGDNVAQLYRFMAAPRHAWSGDLEARIPGIAHGELTASLHYAWQSETYGSSTLDAGRYVIDAYGLADARLHYSLPVGKHLLLLSLWGRNLTDEAYYLAHFNGGAGTPVPSAYWGAPRSVGIDIGWRY